MSSFEASVLKFEFGRRPRFELAAVEGAPAEGTDLQVSGRDTRARGRAHPRLAVGTVIGSRFSDGDRVLQFAGGENDTPTIFARSPYIY